MKTREWLNKKEAEDVTNRTLVWFFGAYFFMGWISGMMTSLYLHMFVA